LFEPVAQGKVPGDRHAFTVSGGMTVGGPLFSPDGRKALAPRRLCPSTCPHYFEKTGTEIATTDVYAKYFATWNAHHLRT